MSSKNESGELETEVLEFKEESKKTSGLSYLVKRAEAGSSGDFEIHEDRPVNNYRLVWVR